MSKQSIDARGELCPKPLIMTKKALKNFTGELTILLDNVTSFENVQRFLADNAKEFTTEAEGGEFSIFVNSDGSPAEMSAAENYCPVTAVFTPPQETAAKRPYVIAFRSDKMGEGDDTLGSLLIQSLCNTIKDAEPRPSALVFYNSGVKLTAESSPALPALKNLEEGGMKMLICGTCVDYFDIKKKIGAGTISNMYDILDCMASAGHVITP